MAMDVSSYQKQGDSSQKEWGACFRILCDLSSPHDISFTDAASPGVTSTVTVPSKVLDIGSQINGSKPQLPYAVVQTSLMSSTLRSGDALPILNAVYLHWLHNARSASACWPTTSSQSLAIRSGIWFRCHWTACFITWFIDSTLLLVHVLRPAVQLSGISWCRCLSKYTRNSGGHVDIRPNCWHPGGSEVCRLPALSLRQRMYYHVITGLAMSAHWGTFMANILQYTHSAGVAVGFAHTHKQNALLSDDFTGPDSHLDYSGNLRWNSPGPTCCEKTVGS